MDRLEALFTHFSPKAEVFFSGHLCEAGSYGEQGGHLHLLRQGSLRLRLAGWPEQTVRGPAALFLPHALAHQIAPLPPGADLVCARVRFGSGAVQSVFATLEPLQVLTAAQEPMLLPVLELLFDEAAAERCGRQVALDHLASYFLVALLRPLMSTQHSKAGLLRTLADPRLAQAVVAMHTKPEQAWTLESLAEQAAMSRSRFAHHFHQAMGLPALQYLTQWRLSLVPGLLEKGHALKAVATRLGYRSAAALSRAHTRHYGYAPTQAPVPKTAGPAAARTATP